jgi:hypothetical protein
MGSTPSPRLCSTNPRFFNTNSEPPLGFSRVSTRPERLFFSQPAPQRPGSRNGTGSLRSESFIARLGDRALRPLDLRRRFSRKRRACHVLDGVGSGLDRWPFSIRPVRGCRRASGASWGVVALLRSNATLIAPLAAGWLRFAIERNGEDRKQGPRPAMAFLAGFVVPGDDRNHFANLVRTMIGSGHGKAPSDQKSTLDRRDRGTRRASDDGGDETEQILNEW